MWREGEVNNAAGTTREKTFILDRHKDIDKEKSEIASFFISHSKWQNAKMRTALIREAN